jgi:hypothetical protein
MKKHGAIIGLALLPVAMLYAGCGQTETVEDAEILRQRAKYVLAAEPQGALSIGDAKTAVEKGEPIVLVGRINAGEYEPWEEGQAAFIITDASAATHGDHQHDHESHAHDSDHEGTHAADHGHGPAEKHEAHDDDHDHGHGEGHETHDGEDDEGHGEEHEAHNDGHDHSQGEQRDAHDDDQGHENEPEDHEHDHDGAHDDEHESGDEPEHEGQEEAHAHEHQGEEHAHEQSAHGHQGHDHEDCPFCDHAKSQTDSRAIVQFVDERGERLPIDARKLLGVKKDQVVVVRGSGKIDDVMGLIISANGIYVRE